MTLNSLSTNKTSKGMLLLSFLMIFAMVLAACGGTNTAAHKVNKNSSLTLLGNAGGDYPRNFNPYNPSVISGTPGFIYETLLYFNRLDGSIKPWLASSYDRSSDATSITFHLRKGVVWSDGQPFTSDDVVFTLGLLKQYPAMDVSSIMPFIKQVSAPDASTMQVTLNKPFYPLLWYLGGQTYMLPKHVWSSVKGDGSQYADPNPVGTGGYTDWITDCQLMAQELLAAGIKVNVNTVAFDAYYNALQNGNYDMAMLWTNPGPTPYYLYDALLRSTNSAPIGQPANSNYERWNDPNTDALLDQYATSTDPTVQKQAIMGLEKIMVEQLPSIPLTNEPYWNQYSTSKFVGWPDAQHPYAAPGTATYPDIEYVVLNLRPAD